MTKIQTILIVDDNAQLFYVLSAKIEQEGYKVLTARDGIQGLEQAFAKHPDLILLDLRMPRVDGKVMLDKLRANPWGKDVPVIVLTNSDSGRNIYLDIKDSVQGYFVKAEVSLKDVLNAIHTLINEPTKPDLA